jgi:hypothetical protein
VAGLPVHRGRLGEPQPRRFFWLIAIATIVERVPIGSSCAADVVPMLRMQRVGRVTVLLFVLRGISPATPGSQVVARIWAAIGLCLTMKVCR